jgi:hypothetical protein
VEAVMWKLSAKTYLKIREELRVLGETDFATYRDKWTNRAIRGLNDPDLATRSKWAGFVDALNDEILARAGQENSEEYETIHRLLDYLYAEE